MPPLRQYHFVYFDGDEPNGNRLILAYSTQSAKFIASHFNMTKSDTCAILWFKACQGKSRSKK